MTLAHARALLPEPPRVERHDAARNAAALDRLAHWALRFTPLVAPDPPDGLRLDLDGCTHLFGGTGQMAETVRRSVERLGFSACVAVAPTYGLAWALARFTGVSGGMERPASIVVPDAPAARRQAITSLPVAALRIEDDVRLGLGEVGIRFVHELLALPRRQVVDRFGAAVVHRIDQALGQAFEPIEPVRPREAIVAERTFTGPTQSAEGIALATHELLVQLAQSLARRELGVTALHVRYRRADLDPVDEALALSLPSRDAKHLWALLRPRVEAVHMGHGIEGIAITAVRTARIAHAQTERWTTRVRARASDTALGTLVDTLHARLGTDRVHRARIGAGHLPEQSFTITPFESSGRDSRDAPLVTTAPRPSRLMPCPEPIAVVCAEGPERLPCAMARRGRERSLVTAIGPERIGQAWWTTEAAGRQEGRKGGSRTDDETPSSARAGTVTRAYYRVQDETGLWWWIYRLEPVGKWYLHGVWG